MFSFLFTVVVFQVINNCFATFITDLETGLSFSIFAAEIVKMVEVEVIAPDVRGHGATVVEDESDLSIQRNLVTH